MKNLVLKSILLGAFTLFTMGSMNAQETQIEVESTPVEAVDPTTGETVTPEVVKEKAVVKPCCAKKGDKKVCEKGEKKACKKEDKKTCTKGDKKACSKSKKVAEAKKCKSSCEKACCVS